MVSLLAYKHTLLAHIQNLQVFLRGLLTPSSPYLYRCLGLPWPRCCTLQLALLKLIRLTWAFSSLSRSLWMASFPSALSAAPLCLVSSPNLVRMHSIWLSGSLKKNVKDHETQNELLIIGFYLDTETLTTTFWKQPTTPFPIHWITQPSNPCISNLEIRMSCRTISKTMQKSR